jgi:hypothetical protein
MHSTSFDHAINCVLVSPLLIDNFRRKCCGLAELGRVRLARREEIARGWWLPDGKTPRDQAGTAELQRADRRGWFIAEASRPIKKHPPFPNGTPELMERSTPIVA